MVTSVLLLEAANISFDDGLYEIMIEEGEEWSYEMLKRKSSPSQ